MKKTITFAMITMVLVSFATTIQPVKATFKVFGNCGMCKERMESALDQKGIKSAEWNIDTKVMEVVYVPEKITIEQIHKIIASVGHDTELEKASDSVYKQLPDCCLYRDHDNTHHD